MDSLTLEGSTLYISARSPFARRVRVAFIEAGLSFREVVLNVFEPQPELEKLNPLVRVPTVELRDGRVLVESSAILEILRLSGKLEKTASIAPKNPTQPAFLGWPNQSDTYVTHAYWSGLAVGVCEKLVELTVDRMKPKESQDAELFAEVDKTVLASFAKLEAAILSDSSGVFEKSVAERGLWLADLDWAIARDYLLLRHPHFSGENGPNNFEKRFPKSHRFFELHFSKRVSFAKTAPPAA